MRKCNNFFTISQFGDAVAQVGVNGVDPSRYARRAGDARPTKLKTTTKPCCYYPPLPLSNHFLGQP